MQIPQRWLATQQIFTKGLLALKFFIIARLIGPEGMGQAATALLILGAAEALSDFGHTQAIISRREPFTASGISSIFRASVARGVAVSIALATVGLLATEALGVSNGRWLIIFISFIPLIRSLQSPGYALSNRSLEFRSVAAIDATHSFIDAAISIALALLGFGAMSIVLGLLLADAAKCTITWYTRPYQLTRGSSTAELLDCLQYGKWIWMTNICTYILNTSDRWLIAKLRDPTALGQYHTASRLPQLLIADVVQSFTQHLLATTSQAFRAQTGTIKIFVRQKVLPKLALILAVASAIGLPFLLFPTRILAIALGADWTSSAPVLQSATLQMIAGSLMGPTVQILRAIGMPQLVTQGVLVQLLILIPCLPIFYSALGILGLPLANAIAIACALTFMLLRALNSDTKS